MTPTQLLADTYTYFHGHGYWPFVRTLQSDYGPAVNVRTLAAEAGRSSITCQEGADGHCMVTLHALAGLPAAADDLERLATVVSFVARQFEERGPEGVTSTTISTALGISGMELCRVGALLSQVARLWSGGSWSKDNTQFSVTPTEQAYFFRDAMTFADFEAVRDRLDRDDRRLTELLSLEYRGAHGEPSLPDSQELHNRLADPALNKLLQRDLAELTNGHTLRGSGEGIAAPSPLAPNSSSKGAGWLGRLQRVLEEERRRRGLLWMVLSAIAALVLAALAL